MITVGQPFPPFATRACVGLDRNGLVDVTSDALKGKWGVFVFYPKDFTFVCPTELVGFAKKLKEFTERDALIFAGSTDNEHAHLAWRQTNEEVGALPYPLLASAKLAGELGILDPKQKVALRATYIVDPQGIVQYVSVHNLDVGRNPDEVLRVLDAIQQDELCPCNWEPGQATLEVPVQGVSAAIAAR